jgi:molecular chaperone Hsp33
MNTDSTSDRCLRFLFEEADIRGESVHLTRSYRDIVALHQYPPGVSLMLGQFLAAATLLSTTLKFEGKLVLQARSEAQIPLLMVECDHQLHVRAIARGAQEATSLRFDQLLGGGQLAITIDPTRGKRYQGIVPLSGDSLAHSLDTYFKLSEQLETRMWLSVDDERAAGLLLQKLPRQVAADPEAQEDAWDHACALTATVTQEELLELPAESLLHRLFHEEPVRLFPPEPVTFRCDCSRQRTFNALSALDPGEIEELLQELGSITMDCEFCNQQYRFEREDLAGILGGDQAKILH